MTVTMAGLTLDTVIYWKTSNWKSTGDLVNLNNMKYVEKIPLNSIIFSEQFLTFIGLSLYIVTGENNEMEKYQTVIYNIVYFQFS